MALSPEATQQLADLTLGLANNPKTRKAFVNMVREIDPSKRFPDVEIDEVKSAIDERFTQQTQQAEAQKVKERLDAQRNSLITSGRFKEDDVQKIEKEVMEKHGISDYEVAAKVYAADMKPANPVPELKSRMWEMPTMDKAALANLGNHARDIAYKTIDELNANKRRA